MKQITITLVLLFASIVSFSQTKFQTGIYAEGGYFFPKSNSTKQDLDKSLTPGGGVFASYEFIPKLLVSVQAGYRYKSNSCTDRIYAPEGGYGSGYTTVTNDFKQHYFVLPFKINYLLSDKLFIEAGVETACLLNYEKGANINTSGDDQNEHIDFVNEKPEFGWIIGLGVNLSPQIKATLNYTQGFKEQGMGTVRADGEDFNGQIYKNRVLMLNLCYAIFNGK